VNDLAQALDSPFFAENGMVDAVEHPQRPSLRVLANPIRLDGERLPNRAAPALGADTADLLAEIGFTADDAARFRAAGVV
jgi:crotonobetainyl-CoA:carnitine CoA-transferase CaiB-like acyl-CoA transferase